MEKIKYDQVELTVAENRFEMGQVAAHEAAVSIKEILSSQREINCIFAAAPSQNDFLDALVHESGIEWERINAFHMDEYVGFGIGHKNSFNYFLTQHIFSKVPFKTVNLINGACDVASEIERYSKLLDEIQVDIVFMGIGENGHIAFNDPGVAKFDDKETVKLVTLDTVCRQQQVNDGCYPTIDDVPKEALTVTIPKLTSAKEIFCIVPTEKKRQAVRNALTADICEDCPASILRRTPNVHMYIDRDCYWG